MHKKFDHTEIEKKWQKRWKESGIYDVGDRDDSKEKEYVLVEWPYPSGNLHVGHWYAFAVPDIYVRAHRMQDKQVLYPMGFDAFGLPAENAAIKRNLNPREWTESNIAYMKEQLGSMGNAFAWNKTCSSTDPEYYKWTQWMFTQFFENDIAYRGTGIVNWDPVDNTVIANEQVLPDGTAERSGAVVERKEMSQWMFRITKYADRLLSDLEQLDWPEPIKEAQRNWIGKSEGAEITFKLSTGDDLKVFTTRSDTLFGATYMVVAPEHKLIERLLDEQNQESIIQNKEEVVRYIELSKQKSEIERTNAEKEKTGVKLEGITATNPANGEEIPVFVADYALIGYGTGALMAVPAHDERDFAFAKKFGVPVRQVVAPVFNETKGTEESRRGAYAVIQNSKGEYLLQYYKKPNYFWLPGGGVQGAETDEKCLRRELTEETGYTDFTIHEKVCDLFYDYTRTDRRTGRNHLSIYRVTLDSMTQQEIQLEQDEIDDEMEQCWISPEKLQSELSKGVASRSELILEVVRQSSDIPYTGNGSLIQSENFNGMDSEEAKEAIIEKVGGTMTNTYKLRDWSVGRQRYWGAPIPIVYNPEGKPHAIPKEHLPWLLPEDVDPKPTGEPPLAKSKELKERTEKIFGKGWTPEVETMDTFLDSAWYFLRYIDNANSDIFATKEVQKDWMPIDIYFGGAEHTTMHLLYSRFWQKVLFDLGYATTEEPYKRRINRGLVLGPDGNKMSKSKGNVIDPDEQVARLGADTVKMYLAFMGPYGEVNNYPWDMGGIAGIRRFLERVNGLGEHSKEHESEEVTRMLHKTIDKVSRDIEMFKFNTAISALMIFLNTVEKEGLEKESYKTFLKLLAPFAPHLSEELWHKVGEQTSIHTALWPTADTSLLEDEEVTIGVQVNGKMRGSITLNTTASEEEAVDAARSNAALSAKIKGEIAKVIYKPGKILNLIVRE